MNLLLVDDDIELCQLLKEYLEQEAMHVSICHNGADAIEAIKKNTFDLMVLDVMMPVKNGFDTLSEIRRNNDLPVIMLTAKGDKIDRIVGLEMGADDYVPKPCDPRELVARIRAIARRTNQQQNGHSNNLTNGHDKIEQDDVLLNKSNRQVLVNQRPVELTATEFDFLELLLRHSGELVSRETISQEVLGKRLQSFDRSIDMHVSNLRKKLGLRTDGLERIKTLRGNGYQYLA
jgi:two-component system response regulator CpxR